MRQRPPQRARTDGPFGGSEPRPSPSGQAGDVLLAEIAAVYQAGFGRFLRVAAAILGDVERARDVVQDAFARAIVRRRDYRGDGSLDAWLWKIVVNHARNCRRHESPVTRLDDRPSLAETAPTADAANAGLRRMIASLPERQRTALFLCYYADLDYGQIAHALGIRPGTVGATLNAARRTLREQLEASGQPHAEESP